MYSRSFYGESEATARPPENYSGTAFTEEKGEDVQKEKVDQASAVLSEKKGGIFSSLLSGFSPRIFESGGALGSLKIPKIGTEELLILAAAAYLFFSKDGDKECAIILFLLIFVT